MGKGGISPYQWVLGADPRFPGQMTEENEWGQLGCLEERIDPTTAFGQKALIRNTSRKNYVRVDCSRRYAAALLRKSVPLRGNYSSGDLVMHLRKQGSGLHSGDTWQGPARIIGFDKKTPWLLHGGVPATSSLNRLRPANTSEMLAHQVLQEGNVPYVTPDLQNASGQLQGYVNAQVPKDL